MQQDTISPNPMDVSGRAGGCEGNTLVVAFMANFAIVLIASISPRGKC